MNLRPRRNDDPEINLISLIDVVLMLVVFFMLSSTFTEEGRVRIRLPEASNVATRSELAESIVLAVTRGGGYSINGRETINSSSASLRTALLEVAQQSRSQRVTVRADAETTHQAVVRALDVLGKMGFREIRIATINEPPVGGTP